MIDRGRLQRLRADEEERFVALHPGRPRWPSEARGSLLAGVPMPWMTRWPGAFPLFVDPPPGARLTDVDGVEYVDLCLGDTGAMTGHALPQVTDAVAARMARGATVMLPSEDAVWVGAELARRFGLPSWQLAMSATDANRFVLRFARHLTGRPRVAVMDWCYHGTVDETLAVLSTSGAVVPRPGALGPQVDVAVTTAVVPFNDVDALDRRLAEGDVACLLLEPALTNIGIVLPDDGYLAAVREVTRRHGVLLVVDETHTMCAGPGGCTAEWGLEPDLLVVGKAIGGGIPCAAYGMTAEVAARAGRPDARPRDRRGRRRRHAHRQRAGDRGDPGDAVDVPARRRTSRSRSRSPSGSPPASPRRSPPTACRGTSSGSAAARSTGSARRPRDGAAAAAAVDEDLEGFLHLWCLNRGVLLTPFHNMALFSPAHTEADVDRHTEVFSAAALSPDWTRVGATALSRDCAALGDRRAPYGDGALRRRSVAHELGSAPRRLRTRRSPLASPAAVSGARCVRYYFVILVTRPAPTVRPPSRIAKRRPSSIAMGWMSSTDISVLSPGMTISVPSGSVTTPVTSVVRK